MKPDRSPCLVCSPTFSRSSLRALRPLRPPSRNRKTRLRLHYLPRSSRSPFVFYFLLIRPQQQQEKKRKELITALKKNDKVLTAAGIYGTVVSVDEKGDKVQLRLDDDGKVKITFTRASIVRVLNESSEKSSETK